MSGYYTKLDSGITDSTIWREADTTRLVWITLLAMADPHGYVGASVPGLADRARVTLDACLTALACFGAPDKWSRSQEYEGRRILDAEGGWVLLNHPKYRATRSAEDRREYMRVLMADKRALAKTLANVSNVIPCDPKHRHKHKNIQKEQKKELAPSGVDFGNVSAQVVADFTAHRKAMRAPITATALAGIAREAAKAGLSLESALAMCCARGWRGFRADWIGDVPNARAGPNRQTGKTMQALNILEGIKHGLAKTGNFDGLPEADLPRIGTPTGR